MDLRDIPPSYATINPDLIELLPPYVTRSTLINLCLVSHTYHTTFTPHLWGSPASHFIPLPAPSRSSTSPLAVARHTTSSYTDTVYAALTRFKQTLREARLSTRTLCHTLHLPPAHAEVYGHSTATWLREFLDWLPALQSLCVPALPFFDHHSLLAVDRAALSPQSTDIPHDQRREYPLRLLLASREPNATAVGLSSLLLRLPRLVYLDLSYTTSARDVRVLSSFHALADLRVLKLRGVGLRDAEAGVLAQVIGLRVRLLDIAENAITDAGLRRIAEVCFLSSSERFQSRHESGQRLYLESWPVGVAPPSDFASLDVVRTVGLDGALVAQLTRPLTGRLALENIPHAGFTHLYLSGNAGVTIEGVCSVLELGRVHVLDAGGIGIGIGIEQADSIPAIAKLISTLRDKASTNLTYLRISHTVVTFGAGVSTEIQRRNRISPGRECVTADEDLHVGLGDESLLRTEIMSSDNQDGPQNTTDTDPDLATLHHHRKLAKAQIDTLRSKCPTEPAIQFHPSMLPNLHTLVLTDLPSHTPSHNTSLIQTLKTLIDACAAETHMARLKAATNYHLPPRQEARHQAARTLFALRTIVLGVFDSSNPDSNSNSKLTSYAYRQRRWEKTGSREIWCRSSTGDIDSENLWTAAEHDFSFFDRELEGGEQAGNTNAHESGYSYEYEQKRGHDEYEYGNESSHQVPRTSVHTPPSRDHDDDNVPNLQKNDPARYDPHKRPLDPHAQQRQQQRQQHHHHHHQPRSSPNTSPPPTEVIASLALYRRTRKEAHLASLTAQPARSQRDTSTSTSTIAGEQVYTPGHWDGEIRVERQTDWNSKLNAPASWRGRGRGRER